MVMLDAFSASDRFGSFVFKDHAAGKRQFLRVFYFLPDKITADTRIAVGMHGLDRKASDFRDVLAQPADLHQMIVLVPEFDMEAFPDVYAYNYGNVRPRGPDAAVLPREHWTFGIIDRLFKQVRDSLGSRRETFGLFGNSAGSQFVLRYLALNGAALVDQAVASNSGIYMLPDLEVAYPSGMGGLDLDAVALNRYFGARLTILLGECDCDGTASDLPRNEEAMAQGPHRLARGLWHFQLCQGLATSCGEQLAWRMEIIAGAGHVDQKIFDRAIRILSGSS
jgi:hypothetical protein